MKNDGPSAPTGFTEHVPPASAKSPAKWPIFLLLAAAVIVPAMFWRQVWFGAYLSDDEIRRRLSRPENPRDVQHACEQISKRMQRDPQGARQFYHLLVSLADHPDERVRYVAAWCMGEDNARHRPFHQALLGFLGDESPRVRYNAALGLVRFDEPAARPVLCKMLIPYVISVDWEGPSPEATVIEILRKKDPVRPRMQLALVDTGEGKPDPVLAPLGGRIGEVTVGRGQRIMKGRRLCTIEPEFQQAYQALRALAVVGEPEDLEYVQPYFDPDHSLSHTDQAGLQTQARLAAEAIRKRREQKKRS